MLKNLNTIYDEYVFSQNVGSSNQNLVIDLWGNFPKNVNEIEKYLNKSQKKPRSSDNSRLEQQEAMYKIIKNFHKKNNFFTPQIQNLIENWFNSVGSIECGHQPLYLGGASFLLNKINYTSYLQQYLASKIALSPVFFIGDHDEMQNELIITRSPQAYSPFGLELKSEYDENYILTPMHKLPKPNSDLLLDHLDKIRQNYKQLFKFSKIKPENRPLLESRLESLLGVIYESYFRSGETFSDWTTQLIGDILIFKNNLPILMIPGSDKNLRELLLPYLEDLLLETNRMKLIKYLNESNLKIENSGFKPGISFRDKDYVPFFLECPNDETRDRVRLSTDGTTLTGTCPKCHEEYSISYNKNNPDMSEYSEFLSPRVDSRSISVNQLIDTNIRVTGGGETSYYAQILPYIRSSGINPVPLILRHPRIYYNTPWSEKKGEELKKLLDSVTILQEKNNFIRISKILKSQEKSEIANLIIETKEILNKIYTNLNQKLIDIENDENFNRNRELKQIHSVLQQYLSLTFGQYSLKKQFQEVSWTWIDLAIVTGLRDIKGFYNRSFKEEMPTSLTLWLSTGKYN